MRSCTSCHAAFYDDGNTLCPRCDSIATARMSGVLPDAAARVLAMRERSQAEAKAALAAKEGA